jgi:hypothetical protein
VIEECKSSGHEVCENAFSVCIDIFRRRGPEFGRQLSKTLGRESQACYRCVTMAGYGAGYNVLQSWASQYKNQDYRLC